MGTGYAGLLRARHAVRLLVGTLVGRLPNATGGLVILLFIRAQGGSYSLAGALSATYGLATAVGQPLLGRLVDLHGQPRVMLPAALASALATLGFAAAGAQHPVLAAVTVFAAGLCTPPLEGGLRALWPGVLERAGRGQLLQAAYALDAVAQEVLFSAGPLLVTLLVAAWSELAALLVIALLGVVGALSVVVSAPSRAWRSQPREAHWLGALRSSGLLVLLGTFFFVGTALGAISVAVVRYADGHGERLIASYLLSGLGFGALLGGVLYGARHWAGPAEGRLRWLVAALAAGYLPLSLMPGPALMTGLAVLAGVFLAPALACSFVVVDRHAPSGTVTEAFSWLVTTFGVGSAAGTGVAGPVVERAGAAAGFGLAGAGGVAALCVLLLTVRALPGSPAGPGDASVPVAASENDRNGAAEPGFRSGYQA